MKNSAQNKSKYYSLPKNNIIKTIIYKNEINNTKKNKNKENFSNNESCIISNTFENEKDFIKRKNNTTIEYDNSTEVFNSNKYAKKENSNNSIK